MFYSISNQYNRIKAWMIQAWVIIIKTNPIQMKRIRQKGISALFFFFLWCVFILDKHVDYLEFNGNMFIFNNNIHNNRSLCSHRIEKPFMGLLLYLRVFLGGDSFHGTHWSVYRRLYFFYNIFHFCNYLFNFLEDLAQFRNYQEWLIKGIFILEGKNPFFR